MHGTVARTRTGNYHFRMRDHLTSLSISTAAGSERETLARLLQLYLHDFSELADIEEPYGDVDDDGTFRYEHIDSYWADHRREPLLFRLNSRIAGFALINDWSASGHTVDYCVAEFFVLRKFRRIGIGARAAEEIIRRRSGIWEIPVIEPNRPALRFWRSVVASMAGPSVEEIAGDGDRWTGTIFRLAPSVGSASALRE